MVTPTSLMCVDRYYSSSVLFAFTFLCALSHPAKKLTNERYVVEKQIIKSSAKPPQQISSLFTTWSFPCHQNLIFYGGGLK